jgi:hypothetical protein
MTPFTHPIGRLSAWSVAAVVAMSLVNVGCSAASGEARPQTAASPSGDLAHAPAPTSGPSLPAGMLEHERSRVAELLAAGTDVYEVDHPLRAGERGQLVKVEPIIETADGRVYRMQYHSRHADGIGDVAVTGSIWIPAGGAPAEGFPIVAWGPGLTAGGDPCAASHVLLEDEARAPLMVELVKRGYVVAQTDYTGHGTRFPEEMVPETGAYSLLDAARAARDLLGSAASNRVVVGGHSLGADRGVDTEVHGPAYDDGLDVRGILALEGGTDHRRYVEHVFDKTIEPWGVLRGALNYAEAYPELRIEDVLTADVLWGVRRTSEDECFDWGAIFGPQPLDNFFAANPLDRPDWAARIDSQAATKAPYPIFFAIAPTSDWHVADLLEVANRLCLDASHVEAHVYPGTDHDTSLDAAKKRFMAWLDERFQGRRVTRGTCAGGA